MKRFTYVALMILGILVLTNRKAECQEFMPFAQSNYAGVSGLWLQPASIADSRYRFDMVLFGINTSFNNNYISVQRKAFYKPSIWKEENFSDDYLTENLNGEDKAGAVYLGAVLPSFMINLSKNSALAFSTRLRGITNIDNITENLAKLASEDFEYEPLLKKTLTNENLSVQGNYWAEFNLSYATVILNQDKHFLKGGATIKYLRGIASGYTYISELNYRFETSDTLFLFQSDVNYGLSNNFDEEKFDPFKSVSKPGFGFDIGFVYEFRPDIEKYRYRMDGQEGLLRPDKDKYKLRIGVSLLDFGKIKYDKGYYSQDFVADVRNWDLTKVKINSIKDLNDTLRNRFNFQDNAAQDFSMGLPTALSLQVDYQIVEGLYLNFTPFFALRKGTKLVSKTHYFTSYNFTPRYDLKMFGVSLPMHIDQFNRFNAGIALRIGTFWIGSNSILTNTIAKNIYNADVYVMAKIPIFRKIERDDDNDGVSDKMDQCPQIAGTWEMHGCPDADGDGIADKDDLCPNDFGTELLKGCPDRDNDGIADMDDRCPDHAGLPENKGCPDTDKDGIMDFDDDCPDQPGTVELKGCPDRDGDGIADKNDKCPDLAGIPEYGGCPFADSDGDGIADNEDDCPAQPGPLVFKGCPDTDGDGISDKYDLCPTVPGIAENNGCPPIQKEELEIIERAFSSLEFESGKSVIKSTSFASLNELASLLDKQGSWKVQLSGHTDNTGNPVKNMELSKNRTQAVKDYLIKAGIKEFRIKTEWFGQDKPIADNKTPSGRQKNRRVEMKIVFN